jgi:hypothetical protein
MKWMNLCYNEVIGRKRKEKKLQKEQDRQCTYNVTWRRVRATVVVVEEEECCIF